METKMFEVRDRDTFIPVIATKLKSSTHEQENWLLYRAGYGRANYVLVTKIDGGVIKSNYDAINWLSEGTRTMKIAHEYIRDFFDALESGAVVDVEYALGDTKVCKTSERF